MITPPLPSNERRRLAHLRALGILDTEPEPFSQSVVAAAASIANAPMAAVTLIDGERTWNKGSHGLPPGAVLREASFCAHAILSSRPTIVGDTLADPRFVGNPFVVGAPYARFYAGFPLLIRDHAVGALCVVDDRPRSLDDDQVAQLVRLAAGTAAWFELRHRGPA